MKYLLLTLGHNSSAILIENGLVVWGYETERITGLKSDSRFPMPFIDEVVPPYGPVDLVYVTHWAPDGRLSSMSAKHWDPAYFDGIPIRTLSADCTHHDTHMAAARSYAGPGFPMDKSYGIVIDGFGTFGEHLSVYELSPGRQDLITRVHGYGTSLGLWYQYATAFMGMKMHEDEYKLLGYEVLVKSEDALRLDSEANFKAYQMAEEMNSSIYGSKFDPIYNLSALSEVKGHIFSHLNGVCKSYGISDPTTTESRAILAYYVQKVLEKVVLGLIDSLDIQNVILSGGVFYNVKLNKLIIDRILGKTCIYPLAGDQGCALGLYFMDHPEFEHPSHFNWGVRSLKNRGQVPNMYVIEDEEEALPLLLSILNDKGYVNLVRGNMEFGPRAMCNTSTLALPSKDSVAIINAANNRNTVMPMAPVMSMEMYICMFKNWDKVWRSQAHMIAALEYDFEYLKEYSPDSLDISGVTHEYHHPKHCYTGRPQVIREDDNLMEELLKSVDGILINTSFNFHGHPIAFDMPSIIDNHMMQQFLNKSFTTVVIKNGK